MKIKHYLSISFGAITVVAFVTSAIIFSTTTYLRWQTARADFSRSQLSTLKDIDITLHQMLQELSSYLLFRGGKELEKFHAADAKLKKLLRYYETLIIKETNYVRSEENSEELQEVEFFALLKAQLNKLTESCSQIITLASRKDPAALKLFEEMHHEFYYRDAIEKLPFQALGEAYEIEDVNQKILALHSRLQYFILITTLVMLVIIGGSAWLLSRSILHPIASLLPALEEIGKGRFHVSIPIETNNEIGLLTHSVKNMAAQLSQVHAQLVQSAKLASIGELTAGMAHELNQPLMVIRLNAQMLLSNLEQRGEPPHDLEEMLRLIERNTRRMDRTIKHLKIFSRQTNNNDERSAVDLNQVIEDSLTMFNEQLNIHGIEVRKTLFPQLPEIWGDANQLEQVFINLIANSKDALLESDASGPKQIEIDTSFQKHTHCVETQISDTGIGVSEEQAKHLFDPFYTTKPVGKGTGLGLSISFGIIQDHGGSIRLLPSDRQGATFLVQLPVENEMPKEGS